VTHSIRLAIESDAEAYEAFLTAIFAEALDTLLPRSGVAKPEQVRKFVASHSGQLSALFLAEDRGQIVGTANLTRFGRPEVDHAIGLGLNVANSARGKGIGRSLLSHALQWATLSPQVERVELEVFANNAPAIHLYESFGFLREGVKRRAVKKRERYIDIYVYGLLVA
jgi:RimJ/RimL family protein N-acetyltransferase